MSALHSKSKATQIALFAVILAAAGVYAGCESDSGSPVKENVPTKDSGTPVVDSGTPGTDADGGDAGPTDCVQNPQTHDEIINGCTDAVRLSKSPSLPLLLADGGLPPLQ